MYLILTVILIYTNQVFAANVKCPPSSDLSTESRLRSNLFCNYDHMIRPVKDRNNNITVEIYLFIENIYIDEHSSQMMLKSWAYTSWTDEFLKWNSQDYDNISHIRVPSEYIWVPDIAIYNSDFTQIMLFSSSILIVKDDGLIIDHPVLRTPLNCVVNLKRWPYDSQNCTLYIGSWAQSIDVKFIGKGYSGDPITNNENNNKNSAWELLGIETYVEHADYRPALVYQFSLKRHAALYADSIIIPAFVLAGLVICSFWIRGVLSRVLICCVSITGDVLFIQYIGFHLPADGDTSPDIVAYYRDAMLLAVMSLAISMTVEGLRNIEDSSAESGKKTGVAPLWLQGTANWLRGSGGKAGQLLLGDDEPEPMDAEAAPSVRDSTASTQTARWGTFATFLDRIAFLTVTATYAVLLISLLP